ncbi:hypothetical protein DKM44_10065 [Deinococcus irradiatisoli]|uniref:DUF418 domain-containing protein n=1 Tax=Deinococcus irradiatisoli TaxID=2202254 RepID=A0A2Z3JHJ7_9DEIO|nr:DUF418 domain-containing protein [Deinococcus irradiatisoli]AWN23526.1 hypothetical protein DKM44_10065 [Deinococcus irradiatisoli]
MFASDAPAAIRPSERALLPDVLRGLALLGILCVNAQDFAGYGEWTQRGGDRAAQIVIDLFFNGKFISVFAMLFGAGAFTLLERGGRALLLRRLAVLLLVGTLHYILVWHGDIIANYAVVGLALVLLEQARPRTLALVGGFAAGWWAINFTLVAAAAPRGLRSLPGTVFANQTYADIVSERAHDFLPGLGSVVGFDGFWLLALFCFGGALYRSGVLWWPQQHRDTLNRLLRWGLGLGLPLSALLAYFNTQSSYGAELWSILVRLTGGMALGLGYIGGLGLLTASGKLGWLRVFAASGRLAMSNYIAQSLIMTSVFYPYGLRQYGQWGALPALLLALGLGLAQVWLSGLYLRHFSSGPLEWLVRQAVYWRGWTRQRRN